MMKFMRENATFVLVVIVFIVGVFLATSFYLGGSNQAPEGNEVATVEGRKISYNEYEDAYNNNLDFYRQFYKDMSRRELEEKFGLRRKSLDSLVNSALLLAEAEREGVEVVPGQVRRRIEATPSFQVNGAFSSTEYQRVLAGAGLKPQDYEAGQLAGLMRERLSRLVESAVEISEEESWRAFKDDEEKVRLRMVSLKVEPFRKEAAVEPTEVEALFEENPEAYRRPAKIEVSVLPVRAADVEKSLEPTDEDLQNYYEEHIGSYQTEKQVKARHVLFRLDENAPPEEEEKIRERARFVLDKAKEGADFAELAKEFSQDSSGPAGGDLGFFGKGQMVPPFERAAFALAPGEVSDLVRTRYGFHIIKAEDVKEPVERPFEEVAAEVRAAWLKEEAALRTADLAEEVNDALYDKELEGAADQFGLTVTTAGPLARGDALPGVGTRPDVSESLFSLEEGEISELVRQGSDYYVFRVDRKIPSYLPAFDEAEGEVEETLRSREAADLARAAAKRHLTLADRDDDIRVLADAVGSSVVESELFSRNDFVTAAAARGEEFGAAFGLSAGEFGPPVVVGGTVWMYQVAERQEASREDFEQKKGEIAGRLREEKSDLLFRSWIEDLRKRRSVEINDDAIGG